MVDLNNSKKQINNTCLENNMFIRIVFAIIINNAIWLYFLNGQAYNNYYNIQKYKCSFEFKHVFLWA